MRKLGLPFTSKRNILLSGSEFNDPIAKTVSWSPLANTSIHFQSHILEQDSESLHFLPSNFSKMVTFAYILIGLFSLGEGLMEYTDIIKNQGAPYLPVSFGLFVIFFGIINWSLVYHKITFSKKSMNCELDFLICKKMIDIDAILGLQIIPEKVIIDDYSYSHFELIMVTSQLKRFLLLAHGSKDNLCKDAQDAAKFLGVPLWDGTRYTDLS